MYKYAEYIETHLSRREILEQMAEEDAEHAKAALKLIRAEGLSENATPKTAQEAREEFKEETMDQLVVLYLLGFRQLWPIIKDYWKWERWATRLGYKNDEEEKEMKKEKLFTVEVSEHLVREIKVSAVDDADAIKMATELLQNERVRLTRENDLDYQQISICGVEE